MKHITISSSDLFKDLEQEILPILERSRIYAYQSGNSIFYDIKLTFYDDSTLELPINASSIDNFREQRTNLVNFSVKLTNWRVKQNSKLYNKDKKGLLIKKPVKYIQIKIEDIDRSTVYSKTI